MDEIFGDGKTIREFDPEDKGMFAVQEEAGGKNKI